MFTFTCAVVFPVSVMFASSLAVAAEFVPVASQRSLTNSAMVIVPGQPVASEFDALSASDFDLFDEILVVTASSDAGGQPASAVTTTTQQSFVAPLEIAAAGSAAMQLLSPPIAETSGEGISFFSATFDIDGTEPINVELSGFISAEPALSPGHAQVVFHLLPQGAASVVSATANDDSPLVALDETLTLAPGRYTLSIFANVVLINDDSANSPSTRDAATVEYDVTLSVVPALGDFDGDGAVGPADLAQLLASWGRCADPLDCPADIAPPAEGDGMVGPADLAALLANWG